MARTNLTPTSKADEATAVQEVEGTEKAKTEEVAVGKITIYPVRSYLDGKVIRRAGGAGYPSPKHDAVLLIAAGLATDQKQKS